MLLIFLLLLVAAQPSFNSVVKNHGADCGVDQYRCADDGTCIHLREICDGRLSCSDASDERGCQDGRIPSISDNVLGWNRRKRQGVAESFGPQHHNVLDNLWPRYNNPDSSWPIHHNSDSSWSQNLKSDSSWPRNHNNSDSSWPRNNDYDSSWPLHHNSDSAWPNRRSAQDSRGAQRDKRNNRCSKAQWKCRSGQCVDSDGKCDGVTNCDDGSDETHALCRNMECPEHLFRCTYGACVDGYSKCDNVTNCVDNSDELHRDCLPSPSAAPSGRFVCADGTSISTTARCDGRADCADGSDESVRACGSLRCHSAHLFQCAYGACVDAGSDCDAKQDCADGSDEAEDLCNRSGGAAVTQRPTQATTKPSPASGECVLPPYPAHGRYTVTGVNAAAAPGSRLPSAYLSISCDPGYILSDNATFLVCLGGSGWSAPMPTCTEYCRLNPHRSVTYNCIVPNTAGGTQVCPQKVPKGTVVIPRCNSPNYYSRSPLPYMKCLDGQFDSISTCEPECGKVTPSGEVYVIGGWSSTRGEFPWHVGIYTKQTRPYMQICGGSIVSSTLVISAAHCFYTDAERLRPANQFAVAAGKLYRPWNDAHDADAHKTDVSDIKIPERYRGSLNNYLEDIALVIVTQPFEYKPYVRPVCLDFDPRFNTDQLRVGQIGKVAGWGLTKEDGAPSQVLLTVNLPYVPPGKCIDESPRGFEEYISGDKFCAGYTNGTSVCKGDSGGGLVFAAKSERLVTRYYLRGVVSTGPRNLEFTSCDSHYYTTFTETQQFHNFISSYYDRT